MSDYEPASVLLGMQRVDVAAEGEQVKISCVVEGVEVFAFRMGPISAGLFALEIQQVCVVVGGRYAKANAERGRRRRAACGSATTEPAPIGSPPLPPAGPSSSEDVEARPAAVGESERSIESHATKRRRKR